MYSVIFLAVTSLLLSLVLTPLVCCGCRYFKIVDYPNHERKLHRSPVPRVVGIAIAASYLAAFGLLLISPLHGASPVSLPLVLSLTPASMVTFTTGLSD